MLVQVSPAVCWWVHIRRRGERLERRFELTAGLVDWTLRACSQQSDWDLGGSLGIGCRGQQMCDFGVKRASSPLVAPIEIMG